MNFLNENVNNMGKGITKEEISITHEEFRKIVINTYLEKITELYPDYITGLTIETNEVIDTSQGINETQYIVKFNVLNF